MFIKDELFETIRREGNFSLFIEDGFICAINRAYLGHLCGYVSVTKSHPLFGKNYSDRIKSDLANLQFNGSYISLLIDSFDQERKEDEVSIALLLNVYGGITYSSNTAPGIESNIFPDLWWFGFDCAHCDDLIPFMENFGDVKYRDIVFVKEQISSLIKQLKSFIK